MSHKFIAALKKHGAAGAAALLMTTVSGAEPAHAQAAPAATSREQASAGKFFCNTAALNPTERAYHQRLTEKLLASRTAVAEYSKGYELQFRSSEVSIGELAEWVVAESKCCPFFDFHIDLEDGGKLACLRLTGADGIKQFIRKEFKIPEQQ